MMYSFSEVSRRARTQGSMSGVATDPLSGRDRRGSVRIKTVLSGTIYRLGQPAVSSQRRPVRPDTSGRKELFERIRASSPDVLAREFIETGTVYVFADQATYSS